MIGSSHVRAQFSHYVICLRFKTLDIMNEDEEWMRRGEDDSAASYVGKKKKKKKIKNVI